MKKTIETKEGAVIGFSKDDKQGFCWFVRHKLINNGRPVPVNRGGLEWYMTEKVHKAVLKDLKKKKNGKN